MLFLFILAVSACCVVALHRRPPVQPAAPGAPPVRPPPPHVPIAPPPYVPLLLSDTLGDLQRDFATDFQVNPARFAPNHHYDYATDKRQSPRETRGTQNDTFELQQLKTDKWRKLALDVEQFGADKTWMDSTRGWSVVYHGTRAEMQTVGGILNNGFRVAQGNQIINGNIYGSGVYCSSNLSMAKHYANVPWNGKQVIFFCRARPDAIVRPKDSIWLVQSAADIRPVAVLIGPWP